MNKTALITGIAGQDGTLLAQFLRDKGYTVHGLIRAGTTKIGAAFSNESGPAAHWKADLKLHDCDIRDAEKLHETIAGIRPDEIYHLAGISFVPASFESPHLYMEVNASGTLNLLEAVRKSAFHCRIFHASSSELFGHPQLAPQCEETPFRPRSPYGISKLCAHEMTRVYREHHAIHASNGILYNHTSPLQGETFVAQKIAIALARIREGRQQLLRIGNLDSARDLGYAGDYVRAMWMMLQQDNAGDYVIATGKQRTVRELVESAAQEADLSLTWEGVGVEETGRDARTGRILIQVAAEFYRRADSSVPLVGNPTKAGRELGWKPDMEFDQLVRILVNAARDKKDEP